MNTQTRLRDLNIEKSKRRCIRADRREDRESDTETGATAQPSGPQLTDGREESGCSPHWLAVGWRPQSAPNGRCTSRLSPGSERGAVQRMAGSIGWGSTTKRRKPQRRNRTPIPHPPLAHWHCNSHSACRKGAVTTFKPAWSALVAVKPTERNGSTDPKASLLPAHSPTHPGRAWWRQLSLRGKNGGLVGAHVSEDPAPAPAQWGTLP